MLRKYVNSCRYHFFKSPVFNELNITEQKYKIGKQIAFNAGRKHVFQERWQKYVGFKKVNTWQNIQCTEYTMYRIQNIQNILYEFTMIPPSSITWYWQLDCFMRYCIFTFSHVSSSHLYTFHFPLFLFVLCHILFAFISFFTPLTFSPSCFFFSFL